MSLVDVEVVWVLSLVVFGFPIFRSIIFFCSHVSVKHGRIVFGRFLSGLMLMLVFHPLLSSCCQCRVVVEGLSFVLSSALSTAHHPRFTVFGKIPLIQKPNSIATSGARGVPAVYVIFGKKSRVTQHRIGKKSNCRTLYKSVHVTYSLHNKE